jgi:putative transposase
MRPNTPRRLPAFDYVGLHRYFVTLCADHRRPVFTSPAVVAMAKRRLSDSATRFGFSTVAYCFMPDHAHMLLAAVRDDAPFQMLIRHFKQCSSFDYRRLYGEPLWQPGCHERVLRGEEDTLAVARYILENPVRAGLTRTFQDYPFSGSEAYTKEQLADLWAGVQRT